MAADQLAEVWLCPVSAAQRRGSPDWLSPAERQAADQLLFAEDRASQQAAHILLRAVLARRTGVRPDALRFARAAAGRPYLRRPDAGWPLPGGEGLDFNLSHAGDWIAVGVARNRRIGVDVEVAGRVGGGIAPVTDSFTAPERAWLAGLVDGPERERGAVRLWTLKEAYLKARGTGLARSLDSFGFALGPHTVAGFWPPPEDPEPRWRFVDVEPAAGVRLAVAVEAGHAPDARIRLRVWGSPVVDLPARGATPLLDTDLFELVGGPDARWPA